MSSVMWFRRDLRLGDNPTLLSAVAGAGVDHGVVPLLVLDPALSHRAGLPRRAYLAGSLTDLGSRVGRLQLRRGDPVREVVAVARAASATTVHIAEDFGPRGARRDLDVELALASHGIELMRTGSPYAVPSGRVRSKTGDPYQVFTPYSRAWRDHGWPPPPMPPNSVPWIRRLESHHLDDEPFPDDLHLPVAGELAAGRRWRDFLQRRLDDYAPPATAPIWTAPHGCRCT
jgi:deoxyribodipyrimidine photo-lyase